MTLGHRNTEVDMNAFKQFLMHFPLGVLNFLFLCDPKCIYIW